MLKLNPVIGYEADERMERALSPISEGGTKLCGLSEKGSPERGKKIPVCDLDLMAVRGTCFPTSWSIGSDGKVSFLSLSPGTQDQPGTLVFWDPYPLCPGWVVTP